MGSYYLCYQISSKGQSLFYVSCPSFLCCSHRDLLVSEWILTTSGSKAFTLQPGVVLELSAAMQQLHTVVGSHRVCFSVLHPHSAVQGLLHEDQASGCLGHPLGWDTLTLFMLAIRPGFSFGYLLYLLSLCTLTPV